MRVDGVGETFGEAVQFGAEGFDRPPGSTSSSSAPSFPFGFGQFLRPVDFGAGDERCGGVAEADFDRPVAQFGDRDLAERGEFVEQQVAAVEQVVRFGALGHRAADRPVQQRDFFRLLFDFAAFAGDRRVFAFGELGACQSAAGSVRRG